MAHPQQRLSRRDQFSQEPQGPQAPGLDMASLVAMLTHLYGISQQQAQMPGQMQHQDLQNQLDQMQLKNAPQELQRKDELAQAQISALSDRSHIDPMYPYAPPEVQRVMEDKQYPELGQNREAVLRQKDVAEWPQLVQRFSKEPMDPTFEAQQGAHWGAPGMEHLRSLHPSLSDQVFGSGERFGQKLRRVAPLFVPGLQNYDTARAYGAMPEAEKQQHMQQVQQFLSDLFSAPQPQLH